MSFNALAVAAKSMFDLLPCVPEMLFGEELTQGSDLSSGEGAEDVLWLSAMRCLQALSDKEARLITPLRWHLLMQSCLRASKPGPSDLICKAQLLFDSQHWQLQMLQILEASSPAAEAFAQIWLVKQGRLEPTHLERCR